MNVTLFELRRSKCHSASLMVEEENQASKRMIRPKSAAGHFFLGSCSKQGNAHELNIVCQAWSQVKTNS